MAYNPNSSPYKDLFDEKFTSFNPEQIVSNGNNSLKSGQFDRQIETTMPLGYKNTGRGTEPNPGKFFDTDYDK